jgi:hypothetical protein
VELNAAGILSALAAAVLAGLCGAERAELVALTLSFVVAATLTAAVIGLAPAVVAAVVATAAILALARPGWRWVAPVGAGICAACWVSVLATQGLPFAVALPAAGALVATAVALAARRLEFAPPAVRDESLVLVAVFALVVAIGADLVAGWHSGLKLAKEPLAATMPNGGLGLVAVVVGCLALGGLYALWKR